MATHTIRRPQPIGALPLPAGYLLVSDDPGLDTVVKELLAGRLPQDWPDELAAMRLALAGDTAGAIAAVTGDDAVARVNRFVLEGSPEAFAALGDLDGDIAAHVHLVAYSLGLTDDVPPTAGLDGELAALAHAAVAASASEAGDHAGAAEALERAVDAARPVGDALTGQLLGALAVEQASNGMALGHLMPLYDQAIALLEPSDLAVGLAELHMAKAMLLQEASMGNRGTLAMAAKHYQVALRLVDETTAPELFASGHANLAAAYLTMPMVEASDQLRVGVAVQSLRQALLIFRPETHPERWASAQLNLANALVYMPSGKRGDNIVEAVELYEAVLESRDADEDPLAYARAAANQGNALAHLGIFDHAKGRLHEARFLFEQFEDFDSVATVRSVLDEIAKQTQANSPGTNFNASLPPKPGELGFDLPTRYPTTELAPDENGATS